MKPYIYLIIFIFVLIACKEEKELQIPEDILTHEKLTPILVDMHIADATLISQQLDNEESRFKGENYYEMVFKKHNITRNQFNKSIKFYARHPVQYEEIYDDVIATLSYRQGEISKLDSIEFAEYE